MRFSELRELIWPLLEKCDRPQVEQLNKDEFCDLSDKEKENIYEWSMKCYDAGDKRKSNIENKSNIFIAVMGFLVTILVNVNKDIIGKLSFVSETSYFHIFFLNIAIIYMCRVVWFAIKALERDSYHVINLKKMIKNKQVSNEDFSINLINYANSNAIVINGKVNNMTMAQEYFKRVIAVFFLYAVLMLLYILYCAVPWELLNIFALQYQIITGLALSIILVLTYCIIYII